MPDEVYFDCLFFIPWESISLVSEFDRCRPLFPQHIIHCQMFQKLLTLATVLSRLVFQFRPWCLSSSSICSWQKLNCRRKSRYPMYFCRYQFQIGHLSSIVFSESVSDKQSHSMQGHTLSWVHDHVEFGYVFLTVQPQHQGHAM